MIAFDYKEAMAQAKELSQISAELKTLVNGKLKAQQAELACAWQGDSANLFFRKTEELFKDLSNTARMTAGVADAVEVAAKAIKAAEDAAEQLVKTIGLA